MLAIALGGLLRPNEGLGNAYDVIETVGSHTGEQRFHVVLALGPYMFA
jgi:hypothetical protein